MNKWTAELIPDQTGKIFIITGANSGLGLESTRALARKRATVIMACRNLEKGKRSLEKLRREIPDALLDLQEMDLANLESIRNFVTYIFSTYKKIDVLINNAGIMATPFAKTKDGFEIQFGINHLGHFVLTGLLFELLLKAPGSRVVNVSSMAARRASIDFDNLMGERSYVPWKAYGQTKLANLLFTFELQRRLETGNNNSVSIAAHPGGSATNLHKAIQMNPVVKSIYNFLIRYFMQSAAKGALPQLYAATSPEAVPGDYYGPDGFNEIAGYPAKAHIPVKAKDEQLAEKLWQVSEKLTGINYEFNPIIHKTDN